MRSFRGRVVAALGVVTLLTLGAFVAFVFLLFRQQLEDELDSQLVDYGRTVVASIASGASLPDPPLSANQLGAVVLEPNGDVRAATRLFEPELEGHEIEPGEDSGEGDHRGGENDGAGSDESGGSIGTLSALGSAATSKGSFVTVPGQEGTDLRAWVRTIEVGGQRLTVAALAPASASDNPAARLLAISLIGLGVAVALVGTVAWTSGGLAVRPLARLTRDVHELDEQDLTERVDVPRAPSEVAEVASALNTLLDRIEASLGRERQFIADASHELRSPLAILRGELELAAKDKDPAKMGRGLEAAIGETDRLAQLADDLLLLARTEAGFGPAVQATSLADMTGTAIMHASPSATRKRVQLSLEGEDSTVSAQPILAERAIANLIENAVDYAPEDSVVTARLWAKGRYAGVEVIDEGPGIPEQNQVHVFERFARADESRSRTHGGFGLGLAIVQSIMKAGGGSAILVSSRPGMTVFRLTFPRSAE
jgi:signal transduction histidine kinase